MKFIEGFTFKAVAAHDEFYVDDGGKRVIFRTINGKVVPIHTTAEEYAEWLLEQGVNIDPADQKQLRAADDRLRILEQAGQLGGPEAQAQVEKQLEQASQEQAALNARLYQQALERQSAQQNIPVDRLREDRKKKYEESKDRLVDRKDMIDRGWESYTESYVGKMIESAGFEEKSGLWYVMQAYDLMLRKALDKAKSGEMPGKITLDSLVEDELNGFSGLKRHWDNYAKFKERDENGNINVGDFSVESNMTKGVEWLKDNLTQTTEATSFLRDAFDSIYGKMYDDFNQEKTKQFERIQPDAFKLPMEAVPKELPATFSPKEANAVFGYYHGAKGSKRNAASRATVHTVARLYDSIPVEERPAAISELSDGSRGLHAVHKSSYMRVFHDKEQLGVSVDVEQELEDILRIAARYGEGTTNEKIQALKQISSKLGLIDGAHTLEALGANPNLQKFKNKWQDASMEAGRRKGVGPDLIDTLTDTTKLKAAMFSNRAVLKLAHKGNPGGVVPDELPVEETVDGEEAVAEETAEPLEKTRIPGVLYDPNSGKLVRESAVETPPEKTPAKKPKAKRPGAPTILEGVTVSSDKKTLTTKDGFVIRPDKESWKISSPDGDIIGEVFPDKSLGGDGAMRQAVKDALSSIKEYNQEASTEKRLVPGAMFGFADKKLSHANRTALSQLTEKINESGLGIKEVIPGAVYEITGGAEPLRVAYDKRNASITFLKDKLQPISLEDVYASLGQAVPEETPEEPKAELEPVNVPSEGEGIIEEPEVNLEELHKTVTTLGDKIRDGKGFSFNVSGNTFLEPGTVGFVVSKTGKEYEKELSPDADIDEEVKKFYLDNYKELSEPGTLFGNWMNSEGRPVLDMSEVFTSKEEAIKAGKDRGQTSIWDNENGVEINLAEDKTATVPPKSESPKTEEASKNEPKKVESPSKIEHKNTGEMIEDPAPGITRWYRDNPRLSGRDPKYVEDWLSTAKNKPTAGFRGQVNLDEIINLPGMSGEHERIHPGDERVAELVQSMKEKGYDDSEPVFINVEQDGTVHVNEGNHRMRAAREAGLTDIPVEVRYYGGSDADDSIWMPDRLRNYLSGQTAPKEEKTPVVKETAKETPKVETKEATKEEPKVETTDEPIKLNPVTPGAAAKRAKEKLAKAKAAKPKPPKERIRWNNDVYGDPFTPSGKVTAGLARWVLHNLGYANPTVTQINKTMREYEKQKGWLSQNPDEWTDLIDVNKSLLRSLEGNFITNFRIRR